MTATPETFPNSDMPTITTDMGAEHTNMDREITYLNKNNIDKDIRQKLRNKDVYKSNMHNIYNLIVVQKNNKLQENSASYATI